MTNELVRKAEALQKDLRDAAHAEIEEGAYERAQTLLGLVKDAEALTGRLELLGGPRTTGPDVRHQSESARPSQVRFRLTGSRLVMTGRARNGSAKEYQHEVPLEAVETILRHVRALGDKGQVFSHRELIDRYGRENPEYHVYTVTRLLREKGVMKRNGRGVYRVEAKDTGTLRLDALPRLLG